MTQPDQLAAQYFVVSSKEESPFPTSDFPHPFLSQSLPCSCRIHECPNLALNHIVQPEKKKVPIALMIS